VDCRQNRDPGTRDAEGSLAQQTFGIGGRRHVAEYGTDLESVQKRGSA
jgi:hypothetical protein